jgi:hypothetical protein
MGEVTACAKTWANAEVKQHRLSDLLDLPFSPSHPTLLKREVTKSIRIAIKSGTGYTHRGPDDDERHSCYH